MIGHLWLIGIGTGSLAHLTFEGRDALREAAVILLPQKGPGKDDLAGIRTRLIRDSGSMSRIAPGLLPSAHREALEGKPPGFRREFLAPLTMTRLAGTLATEGIVD